MSLFRGKYLIPILLVCLVISGFTWVDSPVYGTETIYLTWTGYDDDGNRIGGRTAENISVITHYDKRADWQFKLGHLWLIMVIVAIIVHEKEMKR